MSAFTIVTETVNSDGRDWVSTDVQRYHFRFADSCLDVAEEMWRIEQPDSLVLTLATGEAWRCKR